jgi:hypothetical protein
MNWKLGAIVFLIILNLGNRCSAQLVEVKEKKSGYLGKYNVVNMKVVGGLGYVKNDQDPGLELPSLTYNKEIGVSLERAINNSKSLKLNAGLSRTTPNVYNQLARNLDSYFDPFVVQGDDGLEYHIVDLTGRPLVTETFFGLEYRSFGKNIGGIAPVGYYYFTRLSANVVKVDLSPILFTLRTARNYHDDETFVVPTKNPISRKVLPMINAGFGRAHPISKNVVLDLGFDIGYLFVNIKQIEHSEAIDDMLEYAIYKRIRRNHFVNYSLGMSYVF